jgi:hypothetical protein
VVPADRQKREPTRQEKEQIIREDVSRELRYAAYDILHRIGTRSLRERSDESGWKPSI